VVLDCALPAGFETVALLVNTDHYGRAILDRPFVTRRSVFDEVLILRKPK
jgi:hypothetical protein